MNKRQRDVAVEGKLPSPRKEKIKMSNQYWEQAMEMTEKMNNLDDEIAMEWYGVPYDELGYDERDEVFYEMEDRMETLNGRV